METYILTIILLILICVSRKFFFVLTYLYSFFYVYTIHNIYIPVVLNRKLMYIPVKRERLKFYLIEDGKISDLDKGAISFLNAYSCKLNKNDGVSIFHLRDNIEKLITMSEL